MADPADTNHADAPAKRLAAEAVSKAWADAVEKGIPSEIIAGTALSAALSSLVKSHGSEAAARMLDRFAAAVRSGKFDHANSPKGGKK